MKWRDIYAHNQIDYFKEFFKVMLVNFNVFQANIKL